MHTTEEGYQQIERATTFFFSTGLCKRIYINIIINNITIFYYEKPCHIIDICASNMYHLYV